jgi:hypothetical protein
MKTTENIERYFNMILAIRYDNEHGGAYAYVQALAYTREVVRLLRPVRKAERHIEAIEGINWIFNEYLAVKFTHRQRVIFENRLGDLKRIFDSIRETLKELDTENANVGSLVHAQAA